MEAYYVSLDGFRLFNFISKFLGYFPIFITPLNTELLDAMSAAASNFIELQEME